MTGLCSKKRRGFNLIEAAIVLGVVGLVVAGIWVAAAAISERREINNVKDFVLYGQGEMLKYSQNYPITTSLSVRNIAPANMPGNFKLSYYSSTVSLPVSDNHKIYGDVAYHKQRTQDGYIVDGSFNWYLYFLQDATIVPSSSWTYVPRPGVCAGLLSWAIAQAETSPVLLGYADVSSPSTKLYWDARTGAAPPTLLICNTVVKLDVFIW